jgi:phosphonate transport system ATP-binding protein|tara:strand:+ start:19400 stop:20128 length:729 start_codon:yes stop_codon:yes gene_type:complete
VRKTILKAHTADIGFQKEEPLVRGLDLSLNQGEIFGVIGRSGLGKTTLIRTIAGLVPLLSGEISFQGIPVNSATRGSIGLIPQRLGLVSHQSVGYNVLMGALPRANLFQTVFSLPSREMRDATREAIRSVGLSDKSLESVNRLSGGEQRRVAIARAMVQSPQLLLADECLGELDAVTAREIIHLLREIADSHGVGIIIVDHNPARASTFCDSMFELRGSRLLTLNEDDMSPQSGLPQVEGAQ